MRRYSRVGSVAKRPNLIEVEDDYPRIAPYAKAFAAANGLTLIAPLHERTEAYASLAYEQSEQMPDCDFFAQTIASGMGPIGFLRGHEHLVTLGLADHERMPRILCIQSSETNAMSTAYNAGRPELTAADLPASFPDDLFEPTLNSTNPVNNYGDLRDCLNASGGRITDVDPACVRQEGHRLVDALERRQLHGRFDLERSLMIGWAGLVRLADERHYQQGDRILLLATGRGDARVDQLLEADMVIRIAVHDPKDVLERLGAAASVPDAASDAPPRERGAP